MVKMGYNILIRGALMKKRSLVCLILGIILIIFPYLFKSYSLIRLVILLIGIFVVTLGVGLNNSKNILAIILLPIILLCLTYGTDILLFYLNKRIPIYTYELKSSDQMSTYNSFFYRIYNCNKEYILDYGYKKSYTCSNDLLESLNINDLLSTTLQTYEKYQNKFIKVKGKISVISGMDTIGLSLYTDAKDNINGYVNFNLNNNLNALVNEDLSKYRIYDNIEIIGRVYSLNEDEGINTINLVDVLLIPSTLYDKYSYDIKTSNSKELVPLIPDKKYYLYGIDTFNIKYDDNNIYELSYLFSDTRFTWNNLIGDSKKEEIKDENDIVAYKYDLDNFNLLECINGKKIIANKKLPLNANSCLLEE